MMSQTVDTNLTDIADTMDRMWIIISKLHMHGMGDIVLFKAEVIVRRTSLHLFDPETNLYSLLSRLNLITSGSNVCHSFSHAKYVPSFTPTRVINLRVPSVYPSWEEGG
jgi:hypothetical protein